MSARISPSLPAQRDELSIYQEFANRTAAADDEVIFAVDKTKAPSLTSASTQTFGQKLYRFFFGQKKSDIVQEFSAALEAKYGKEVASFAFSEDQKQQSLNAGLSKSMVKQVIENASFARQAKDDIEAYVQKAEWNIAIAQKVCSEIKIAELRGKFQKVQNFATRSLNAFTDVNALKRALQEANTVATTSKQVLLEATKAREVAALREQEIGTRTQELGALKEKKLVVSKIEEAKKVAALETKFKELERGSTSSQKIATAAKTKIVSIQKKLATRLNQIDQARPLDSSSRLLSDVSGVRVFARLEQEKKKSQLAIQQRAHAQLAAAGEMAPEQTILAETRCASSLYQATQAATQLVTTDRANLPTALALIRHAEEKIALANTILDHATTADESAKSIAATAGNDHAQVSLASQIFAATEQAKFLALSPNNTFEVLELKKNLAKTRSDLQTLAAGAPDLGLQEMLHEIVRDHAAFLLAESRDSMEATALAQKITTNLVEAWKGMEAATLQTKTDISLATSENKKRLETLFTQQQEATRLLQQAVTGYAMLTFCQEIETHRSLFHDALTSLRAQTSEAQILAPFAAIEQLISTDDVSFPHVRIDALPADQANARLIGLNGKLTMSHAGYDGTPEDYENGIHLVRLSIAHQFGIDAVARFDGQFRAKLTSIPRIPLLVGELARFIKAELTMGAAHYFLTPASSLEGLRDQLESIDDHKIIRSDASVDAFNPFDQSQALLPPRPSTPAQSNQEGIDKAHAVILGSIESKEENPLEVKTMEDLFTKLIQPDEKKTRGEPLTVGALKKFLDEAILLRGPLAYKSRHFKRYLRTEKAAESFSDTIAWHAVGLSTASALEAAGSTIAAHSHLALAVEPTAFILGLLTYVGANMIAPYIFRGTESSGAAARAHH